jgi:4-diphosphocytidyl-2-C-methyl-D-erythritol kinase
MTVSVRSFAKINLGLYIGPLRADGFHDLRTVYQTIALHDVIRVGVGRGSGIEIRCEDERVPRDASNTCHKIAERVMAELGANGHVTIEIEKRLPVQGGLGAASSNAVATMIALERVLRKSLTGTARLRIAAEVGSDLPLFVVGGTVLGVGRGEEVYPLEELPSTAMVVVTPEVGVSTPQAFRDWDELTSKEASQTRDPGVAKNAAQRAARPGRSQRDERLLGMTIGNELTQSEASDRLLEVGRVLSAWLSTVPHTGAPARSGSRAGSLLLDLVRTGIENDFERVVFPKYPELRDIKGALERAGSRYASLSGSGSTLYGLFGSPKEAVRAAGRLRKQGLKAVATRTLTRREYWRKSLFASR